MADMTHEMCSIMQEWHN